MTDERSPLDNALDLLVYAPVGLALTAAEELPKLAAKGRAQVQNQMTIARMVGQFAVAQGRKEIEKRLGGGGRTASPAAEPSRSPGQPGRSPGEPARSRPDADNEGSYERMSGRPDRAEAPGGRRAAGKKTPGAPGPNTAATGEEIGAGERGRAPAGERGTAPAGATDGSVIDVDFGTGGRPVPSSGGLAIPGYDSLSASQVVQRLAGLSQDELAAVGEYEAANRGRRTILTRVGQLKG